MSVTDKIRDIWSEKLRLDAFSDTDDFFTLGGHSLIMAKIQTDIAERLGVEVPMDELFRHSTVASTAEYVESLRVVS